VLRPTPNLLPGFEERVVFPCRATRSGNAYVFDCHNRLGDRFIYRFTAHTA
jgi:hypothetical protein